MSDLQSDAWFGQAISTLRSFLIEAEVGKRRIETKDYLDLKNVLKRFEDVGTQQRLEREGKTK